MNTETFEFHGNLNNFLLFKKLKVKLGSNYVCQTTKDRATESRGRMDEALEKYFEHFILMNFVSKWAEHRSPNEDPQRSTSSTPPKERMGCHPLHLNPFRIYLQEERGDVLRCQGVDEEFLAKHKQEKEDAWKQLSTEVDAEVRRFCIDLTHCLSSWSSREEKWSRALKQAAEEHASKLLHSEARDAASSHSRKELDAVLLVYFKELCEGVSTLYDLFLLHEEKLGLELGFATFFHLKCEAFYLKIKLLEVKTLQSTYTRESVLALEQISELMSGRGSRLSAELVDKKNALRSYTVLGPQFEALVDEYAQLSAVVNRLRFSIDTVSKGTQEEDFERTSTTEESFDSGSCPRI